MVFIHMAPVHSKLSESSNSVNNLRGMAHYLNCLVPCNSNASPFGSSSVPVSSRQSLPSDGFSTTRLVDDAEIEMLLDMVPDSLPSMKVEKQDVPCIVREEGESREELSSGDNVTILEPSEGHKSVEAAKKR